MNVTRMTAEQPKWEKPLQYDLMINEIADFVNGAL
jgi:hypothetical protein